MKLGIIGMGNMATAIAKAVIQARRLSSEDILAYDRVPEQLTRAKVHGIGTASSLKDLMEQADTVFFSVKPQDMEALIADIRTVSTDYSRKLYISICAGISTDYLCWQFGCPVAAIRVMPNAPILIGCGATAITRNKLVSDKVYSKICALFACAGEVSSIPEELMNAVIAINSTSPAYFYEIVRIMSKYGVEHGFDEKTATTLAVHAMLGASKMLMETGKSPEELVAMVKSKKGTTEAALDTLKEGDLEGLLLSAMDACTNRAAELGK